MPEILMVIGGQFEFGGNENSGTFTISLWDMSALSLSFVISQLPLGIVLATEKNMEVDERDETGVLMYRNDGETRMC